MWAVVDDGIYYVNSGRRTIEFFNFATHQRKTIRRLGSPLRQGLDVSPDGRWLIYTQLDQAGADLMLVENFR